ncbi:MAG: D-ribitol-5-phosphate cytidylyltransferase, partial [Clostridiales bacterium]|nr:D-ribitol-5-phosphate cytidylyltransferase [Clostridiales bacterium]
VSGKPILIRTLETFLSVSSIDKVTVSMNTDWEYKYRELIEKYGLDSERMILVPGGNSRFTSLINIVSAAQKAGTKGSVIVTHDCARLFVTKDIIENNIAAMKEYNIVTTSVPVIDTVLSTTEDGKSVDHVPDRSKLINDQGPQTFYVDTFLDYARQLPESRLPEFIEAGKLYLEHGEKIGIIRGNRYNFKVTNEFDLKYAEFLIKEGYVK